MKLQRQYLYHVFVLLLLFIFSVPYSYAGGKELKWKSFDEGFAEAKKTNKKIMLDVYTDWCKWCKTLDKEVYGNDKISEYLSKQYVVVKYNPESSEKVTYKDTVYSGPEFAQAFGVSGFPKIIFFESDGTPINYLDGFVPADKFLPVIKFIGDDYFKKMSWKDYQTQQQTGAKVNK